MRINIKADTKEINKSLTSFQKKQIPFATSKAINKTAFQNREFVSYQGWGKIK